MTDDIKWENPPTREPSRCDRVYAALRTHPGDWALVHEGPTFEFFPWWARLLSMEGIEHKPVSVRVPDGTSTGQWRKKHYFRYNTSIADRVEAAHER